MKNFPRQKGKCDDQPKNEKSPDEKTNGPRKRRENAPLGLVLWSFCWSPSMNGLCCCSRPKENQSSEVVPTTQTVGTHQPHLVSVIITLAIKEGQNANKSRAFSARPFATELADGGRSDSFYFCPFTTADRSCLWPQNTNIPLGPIS